MNLGSTRTLTADFTAAGALANPTTVVLTITAPNGTVTTPAPVHDGLGLYHYDLVLDQTGEWEIEWEGTGAVPVEGRETIIVTDPDHQGPASGPGEGWITWDDVEAICTPPDLAPVLQAQVLAAASRTMWTRTCKQFGLATIERARVTPCCRHAYSWRAGSGYLLRSGWEWGISGGCGCGAYHFVDLGTAPVVSVDRVWIDGALVDAADYRVDDWRRLVRTDGEVWPTGANMQAVEGAAGTFEVTWTYGVPVPEDGKAMAALLACKMAKDVAEECGSDPSNMTQKVAEGVTITINPPDNDTGVAFVERWLANFHCGGGRIFDPAGHKQTMRVGT